MIIFISFSCSINKLDHPSQPDLQTLGCCADDSRCDFLLSFASSFIICNSIIRFHACKLPDSASERLNGFSCTKQFFGPCWCATCKKSKKKQKKTSKWDQGNKCDLWSHCPKVIFVPLRWCSVCFVGSLMFLLLCPQCWREPPPLRGEGWMWCIEGSQGRNNMVTSPLWVSGSLETLINIGT